MNERLIELYLEGWKNEYWTSDNKGMISSEVPIQWVIEVYELEKESIDKHYEGMDEWEGDKNPWKRKSHCSEYEEAAKRWRKLKMSKLWQSLK